MSPLLESLNIYYVAAAAILFFLAVLIFRFRTQIAAAFEGIKGTLGWVWWVLFWGFPPLFLGIAYATPSLHVSAGLPIPDSALAAVLILSALGGVWFIVQMLNAGSESARLNQLVSDFIIALAWTSLMLVGSGFQAGQSQLELWMALPTFFAGLDLAVNSVVGLRNAWQKNPTEIRKA